MYVASDSEATAYPFAVVQSVPGRFHWKSSGVRNRVGLPHLYRDSYSRGLPVLPLGKGCVLKEECRDVVNRTPLLYGQSALRKLPASGLEECASEMATLG